MLSAEQTEELVKTYREKIEAAQASAVNDTYYVDMIPLDHPYIGMASYMELLGCLGMALDQFMYNSDFDFQLGAFEILEH